MKSAHVHEIFVNSWGQAGCIDIKAKPESKSAPAWIGGRTGGRALLMSGSSSRNSDVAIIPSCDRKLKKAEISW